MELLLGADVGTTRVKTVLFDVHGTVVGQAAQNCPLNRPKEGWVEQDPGALWQALVNTVRQALAAVGDGSHSVLGLSLGTQGGTTIPVDAGGQPLRPAISWMDRRGRQMAAELTRELPLEEGYRLTGWRGTGYSVLAHIAWLRTHEPETFHKARYFLQVNDYLIHRLTGILRQDPSNAGITRLYDLLEGRWLNRALELAQIDRDHLSPLAQSATRVARLRPAPAAELGLSTDTWVMNGAHDQYACALGGKVICPGQVLLSCGTAWVILVTTAKPAFEARMSISRHVVPGRWGALRSLAGVGTTVEWYVDTVLAPMEGFDAGQRPAAFRYMDRHLGAVPRGARGLLCFAVEGGHRPRPCTGGALLGLRADHSKADLGRAVLEGIGYELRWVIETIETPVNPIRSFVMVGGASQSACWPQIIADITNRPVTVPALQEAGARGAALMAGIGLGLFTADDGFRSACGPDQHFTPSPDAHQEYSGLFEYYKSAFGSLVGLH